MPGITRLHVNVRSAVALGIGLACAGLGSAPALAVTPSPPAGAPAVESAPSSLVGLDPQLPAGVVAASAAPGSHWTPEKAVVRDRVDERHRDQGRRRHDDQGQRDLSDDRVRRAGEGAVPRPADDDAVRQGPGRLEQPRLGGLAGRREPHRGRGQLPGPARLHRDRRGRSRHRRLQRQLGPVRSRPAAGRDQGARLGRAPAPLRRARRHLRTVIPRDRPVAARRGGRAALAAEGDLPDGQRQRHLPRHVVHGRAARLRVQRDLPGSHRGAATRPTRSATRRATRRCSPTSPGSRPTTSTGWPAITRRRPRTS